MEFTAARRNQSINYIWIGLLHNKSKSPSPSGPGSWAMPVNLAFLLLSKSQSLSLILLNQLLGHKSPNPKHKAQGRPEPKVQSPRPTRALGFLAGPSTTTINLQCNSQSSKNPDVVVVNSKVAGSAPGHRNFTVIVSA
jgi:hypothetical protein